MHLPLRSAPVRVFGDQWAVTAAPSEFSPAVFPPPIHAHRTIGDSVARVSTPQRRMGNERGVSQAEPAAHLRRILWCSVGRGVLSAAFDQRCIVLRFPMLLPLRSLVEATVRVFGDKWSVAAAPSGPDLAPRIPANGTIGGLSPRLERPKSAATGIGAPQVSFL